MPWTGRETEISSRAVVVPDEENSLEKAKQLRRQLGISGEIGFIHWNQESESLIFPIEKPGQIAEVHVDLSSGVAEVEQRSTGVWDAIIYLHKMPGPHNVDIRGNWIFTKLWGWLADATVYFLLFVSASGVYLWSILKSERRTGLAVLGAGISSFFLLVLALTW